MLHPPRQVEFLKKIKISLYFSFNKNTLFCYWHLYTALNSKMCALIPRKQIKQGLKVQIIKQVSVFFSIAIIVC